MLGVALDAAILQAEPSNGKALLAALRELKVPHILIEDANTPFADVIEALHLPAERIYFFGGDEARVAQAKAAGMNAVSSLADALEIVSATYTRSALNLRYLFRAVLQWRPGHFKS